MALHYICHLKGVGTLHRQPVAVVAQQPGIRVTSRLLFMFSLHQRTVLHVARQCQVLVASLIAAAIAADGRTRLVITIAAVIS